MGSNQYDIKVAVKADGVGELTKLGLEMSKLGKIESFKKIGEQVRVSQADFKAAQANVIRLAKEMAAAEKPSRALTQQYNKARSEVSRLSAAHYKSVASYRAASAGLKKIGIDTRNLKAEQQKLEVATKSLRQEMKQAAGIKYAQGLLAVRPYREVKREVQQLSAAYKRLKDSGQLTGKELYQAQLQLKKKTAELKQETSGWAQSLSSAQAGLIGVAAVGYSVIRSFSSYSAYAQKMAEVNTLLDVSTEKHEQLSRAILKISKDIPQTATDLAAAEYDIISAGVALEDSTYALTKAAKAAVGGVTDTKTAVNVGMGVINAYGKSITDLDEVYDILFQTVKSGVTTFPELSQSIGDVLPSARAASVDFREVSASMAAMTKAGLKTPKAATALKGAINAMAAPTPEAKKKFDELGITWDGLIPTLEQIAEKSLSVDQMRLLIPDVEARTGVLALTQNMDSLKTVLGGMDNAAGSANKAFEKMKDTPANQWILFKNTVNETIVTLTGFVAKAGLPVLKVITAMISGLNDADAVTKTMVFSLMAGGAGFTLWKLGLGSILFGLKGMILEAHAATLKMNTLAASSTMAGIALKTAFAGAVIYTGWQVAKLTLALFELKKAKEQLAESTEEKTALDKEAATAVKEVAESLGVQATTLKELFALEKEGIIVYDQVTGAWTRRGEEAKIAHDIELFNAQERIKVQQTLADETNKHADDAIKQVQIKADAQLITEKDAALEIIKINLAKYQQLLSSSEQHVKDVALIEGKSGQNYRDAAEGQKKAAKALADYKVDAAKQITGHLKTELDKQLADEKRIKGEIESLHAKAKNQLIAKEDELREIKRRGMTESQQQADLEQQASEKLLAAKDALTAGDYKRAEELAKQSKSISNGLKNERDSLAGVKDAWAVLEQVTKNEEESKRAELLKTQQATQKLRDEISLVEKTVQTIADAFKNLNLQLAANPIKPEVDAAGLNEALAKHAELDGTHTHSYHTTHFQGENSTVMPFSEKLAQIRGRLEAFNAYVAKGTAHTTHFTATGSSEKPFSEKVGDLKNSVSDFKDALAEKTTMDVDVSPAEQAIKNLHEKYRSGLVQIEEQLIRLKQNERDYGQTIFGQYIRMNMAYLYDKKFDLENKLGLNSGGSVPGTGNSDTVPAMLTPNEFVEPAPTVRKYGVGFFEALRRRLIPVDAVRALMSGRGYNAGGIVQRSIRPTLSLPRLPDIQYLNAGGSVQSAGGGGNQVTERVQIDFNMLGNTYSGLFQKPEADGMINALKIAKARSL